MRRKFSIFLSFMIVLQFFVPIINGKALAAELSQPTNVAYTQSYPGNVTLTWDTVRYNTKYNVYKITNETKEFVSEVTTNNTTLFNLPEGSYTYAISAANNSSESSLSNPVNFEVVYPEMEAPTNFTFSIQNYNDIVLNWKSSKYANMYHIYEITNGTRTLLAKTNDLTYTIERKTQGKYIYELTSYNNRFGESKISSAVEVDLIYPEILPPANLKVSVVNGNDISLTWDKALNTNQYYIYQVNDNGKTLIGKTSSNTFSNTNQPEGAYYYEVTSYNYRLGESKSSSYVELQNLVFPKMSAPTNLTFSIKNETDIRLNWSPSEFATSYKVYQIIDGESKFIKSTPVPTFSSTYMPKGNYQYEVTSFSDRFGESETRATINFDLYYKDMLAPTGLTHTIKNGNDIVLKWNPVENAESYNIYQVVDGVKTLKRTVEGVTTAVFSKMPEGDYVFEVTSNNTRFGESPTSNSIEITLGNPEILPPLNLTYNIERLNDVVLKWDPSQNANSYKVYKVVNGVKELVETTTDTTYTLTMLPEGHYIYEVSANSDRFGESNTASKVEFGLVYPELLPPSNLKYSTENINDLTLTWDEALNANQYYIYQIENGVRTLKEKTSNTSISYTMLAEGHYVYEVTSYSNRIGESEKATKIELDIEYPVLSAPILSYSILDVNDIVLNWTNVENANNYSVYQILDSGEKELIQSLAGTTLSIVDAEDGNYVFAVQAKNSRFGNSPLSNEVSIKVQSDTTPPTTISNITDSWLNDAFKVKLTATDDKSGVAKTFYSINDLGFAEGNTFEITEPGVFKISFYSIDHAGNVETAKNAYVKIDKMPPVTTSNVVDKWLNSDFQLKLTATDDLSGVEKTYYSLNGSEFVEGTSIDVINPGVNEVIFYSVDNAGNVEEQKKVKVKIDEMPPVTTTNATDEWLAGDFNLEFTATDDLSGVAKTLYSVNGSEFVEGTNVVIDKAGKNKISFYSIDNAGNEEELQTIEVKIDENAPVTTSNAEDKWLKESFILELTATDDISGVAKTFYSVNGSEFVEGTNVKVSQAGKNIISFFSIDHAGNVEDIKTAEVNLDFQAPLTASNITENWNKEEVTIQLKATDDYSGVAATYYSINGSEFLEGTMFNITEEGINTVSFYSIDNAGNIEAIQSREVKIDYTAPIVSWNIQDEYALGTSIPLIYEATDALSGVALENIKVNGQVYEKGQNFTLEQPGIYHILVSVTDNAGWTTTLEKTIQVYIPATIEVTPGVIKANSGDFTVRITLPKGYNTNKIDLNTATLNGVSAKKGTNGLIQQAKNGQFKFNRDDFTWTKGMVKVEFRVIVDGHLVVGSTIVEVK